MNIVIVGTGLIGGSIALALRSPKTRIIGVDAKQENLKKALELGIIDEAMPLEKTYGIADLIILSVPVNVTRDILPSILDSIQDNTTVIDTGSTKVGICEVVKSHPKRKNFVATHPMAGTEFSGPEAALKNLFNGKKTIICDKQLSCDSAVKQAEDFYNKLGMSILYMTSEEHDKHIAYVSHLTHVIAYALSLTVQEIEKNDKKNIFEMAGSGFASTVRIAKSSAAMWTPIFRQNSEYLIDSIDKYTAVLQQIKQLIKEDRNEELFDLLSEANKIKELLDNK
ncbi:MAG: prephenate dehydrogenase [Bacteroidales bacterium]|nr:prephenate dehydrogenase [Bacteroidales bacterium]